MNTLWVCGWLAILAFGADEPNVDAAIDQARQLRQQLTFEKMQAVNPAPSSGLSDTLRQLAEQLLSLQPPAAKSDRTPSSASSQSTASAGRLTAAAADMPADITAAALDTTALTARLTQPEQALFPLQTADMLYCAGQLELAYAYYQRVLQTTPPTDALVCGWAMYQSANCLRQSDPQRASQWYTKLIETYPTSLWAAAANAQRKWVDWKCQYAPQLSAFYVQNDQPTP